MIMSIGAVLSLGREPQFGRPKVQENNQEKRLFKCFWVIRYMGGCCHVKLQ